jgi:hypothetical protein
MRFGLLPRVIAVGLGTALKICASWGERRDRLSLKRCCLCSSSKQRRHVAPYVDPTTNISYCVYDVMTSENFFVFKYYMSGYVYRKDIIPRCRSHGVFPQAGNGWVVGAGCILFFCNEGLFHLCPKFIKKNCY